MRSPLQSRDFKIHDVYSQRKGRGEEEERPIGVCTNVIICKKEV